MSLKDELNGYLKLSRTFFGLQTPDQGLPDVGILGIPYDITSSYMPGCRFGPDKIRAATDSERSHSFPLHIGKDLDSQKPLSQRITVEDIGDLEITGRLPEAALHDITEATKLLSKKSSRLFFLGGDHFITYPILRGIKRGTGRRVGLIYLDAHADYYEDMGGYNLSHATTLRKIINEDIISPDLIVPFDLRSALPEQREELSKYQHIDTIDELITAIDTLAVKVDYLYLSVDIDILRPEILGGVSHPESGGLTLEELVKIIHHCGKSGKTQYADLVELNPLTDATGLAAIAARDIVKSVLTAFALSKELQ